MKRSVAGGEAAVRQLMLHEPVRFREVEGGDVAAHGQMEHEEDAEENDEARKDKGEVDGAVEGMAGDAVDGVAGGREVARNGEDATKRGAGLKALDSGHPLVR